LGVGGWGLGVRFRVRVRVIVLAQQIGTSLAGPSPQAINSPQTENEPNFICNESANHILCATISHRAVLKSGSKSEMRIARNLAKLVQALACGHLYFKPIFQMSKYTSKQKHVW
jgi:hypothetical protein